MKKSRQQYFSKIIAEKSNNSQVLFSTIDKLINPPRQIPIDFTLLWNAMNLLHILHLKSLILGIKFQLPPMVGMIISDGLFANKSVRTNDSLKWTNWPHSPLSFDSFVVICWRAADSRRWFASRSLTVIDSRTETSWLTRASQMHAVFVFSVSCQINEIFECLVNLSRSFMVRSHACDPAGRDPHLGGSWSWIIIAKSSLLSCWYIKHPIIYYAPPPPPPASRCVWFV